MARRNKFDQDEEIDIKVNFSYLLNLGKYIKPHLLTLTIGTLMSFLWGYLDLLPPYFISKVIDDCLPNQNYTLLWQIVAVLIVSAFVVWIINVVRSHIMNKMAMQIIKDIRSDLFKHLQKLPFSFYDSRPHGKILVRVVNYINTISNLLKSEIMEMLASVFKIIIILAFMFAMDVKFTLICLAAMPLFILVLMIVRSKNHRAWQKYSAKQSNLNAYLQESISGMKITQSFARESENAEIFDELCNESKKSWMKAKYIERTLPLFVNILSVVTVILVYAIGANRVSSGTIQIGMLIAFASYVSRFWEPINNLTVYYNDLVNCAAYIERIFQMMDEPVVVDDAPDAKPMGKITGNVKFENVTFRYEPDLPNVLENLSFEVKSGESIALVGPTGAGKSTIINLLSRFYNINSGTIRIDGTDISKVTLKSLRSQMGIMMQDSFLFSGTIMDNIRYSKLDATDEQVVEASKAVCAHDFIMQFPNGYQTEVNEGGTSLSAGQKQLIAFARALLADPAILILDEATSSIDTETEIALQKGLERLLEGRTSFIVAHRLSTIRNSSKIMYIANRNIAECGTHDELLEKHGKYYDLYMAQYKFLEQI